MKKTNALRELDRAKIPYGTVEYDVDESDLSALSVALKTGEDLDRVFKTLVLLDEKRNMIVACIPGAATVDLKKLARVAGVKRVEMLPLKDLLPMTGYIRGGCSPIGISGKRRTFLHESALDYEKILVSAGTRGLQAELSPKDLIRHLGIVTGDLVM
ncbi:MAG: Cys-tRNA(Pro) deacylase [Fusobacteriaceae bacterium]|jgi:Cys-tRNA(Pro)/Cys-tRNA(Cys) deacylase|nr:Cys-tRNA(Pro) deacylase [Fusobacteriaceae bacterium]